MIGSSPPWTGWRSPPRSPRRPGRTSPPRRSARPLSSVAGGVGSVDERQVAQLAAGARHASATARKVPGASKPVGWGAVSELATRCREGSQIPPSAVHAQALLQDQKRTAHQTVRLLKQRRQVVEVDGDCLSVRCCRPFFPS